MCVPAYLKLLLVRKAIAHRLNVHILSKNESSGCYLKHAYEPNTFKFFGNIKFIIHEKLEIIEIRNNNY